MPLEDRKKAVILAREKAKAAPPPSSTPEKPAAKPALVAKAKAKPAPKPAEAASAKPEKPVSKPAPAEAATPAKGDWRIQLGAFSQKGSAEALYAKLSGKSALAGRHAYYIPVGAITRLQVGPFESKAAAANACKALGQACFPVAAK
jgi:cell division septation protein DedD